MLIKYVLNVALVIIIQQIVVYLALQLLLVMLPHVLLLIYNVTLLIMVWFHANNAQLINMIQDQFVKLAHQLKQQLLAVLLMYAQQLV